VLSGGRQDSEPKSNPPLTRVAGPTAPRDADPAPKPTIEALIRTALQRPPKAKKKKNRQRKTRWLRTPWIRNLHGLKGVSRPCSFCSREGSARGPCRQCPAKTTLGWRLPAQRVWLRSGTAGRGLPGSVCRRPRQELVIGRWAHSGTQAWPDTGPGRNADGAVRNGAGLEADDRIRNSNAL